MNVLSRYLSHALVLVVVLGVGAAALPGAAAVRAHTQVTTAFASSGAVLAPRVVVPPGGCQAPPAIPRGASLEELAMLQGQVQGRLNGCAARIADLNGRISQLDAAILAEDGRLASERDLLAGLARDLYRRPQSVLVALASSPSLGDFLTSVADLQSAGARARQLTQQMQADEATLRGERGQVAAAQQEESSSRAALASAVTRLQQLRDAAYSAYIAAPEPAYRFAVPPGRQAVIDDIVNAFSPLGQPAVQWGLRVARCESNYNPDAVNPYSGTEGLFQFMPSTWRGTPYGHDNVFDPKYNALGAAWVYSREGGGPWQCS